MNYDKFIKLQKVIDDFGKRVVEIAAEDDNVHVQVKTAEDTRRWREDIDYAREQARQDNLRWLGRRRAARRYGSITDEEGIPNVDVSACLREARRRARYPWILFSDCHPTKEDKDEDGLVIVRCGNTILTEKFRITNYKFAPYLKDAYEWARIRDVVKR